MKTFFLIVLSLCPTAFAFIELRRKERVRKVLLHTEYMFLRLAKIIAATPQEAKWLFNALYNSDVMSEFAKTVFQKLENEASFAQAWTEALFADKELSILPQEILLELKLFAKDFGLGNITQQCDLCNQFARFCAGEAQLRMQQMEKNRKLYLSAGVLMGGMVFILLF